MRSALNSFLNAEKFKIHGVIIVYVPRKVENTEDIKLVSLIENILLTDRLYYDEKTLQLLLSFSPENLSTFTNKIDYTAVGFIGTGENTEGKAAAEYSKLIPVLKCKALLEEFEQRHPGERLRECKQCGNHYLGKGKKCPVCVASVIRLTRKERESDPLFKAYRNAEQRIIYAYDNGLIEYNSEDDANYPLLDELRKKEKPFKQRLRKLRREGKRLPEDERRKKIEYYNNICPVSKKKNQLKINSLKSTVRHNRERIETENAPSR